MMTSGVQMITTVLAVGIYTISYKYQQVLLYFAYVVEHHHDLSLTHIYTHTHTHTHTHPHIYSSRYMVMELTLTTFQ